MLLSGLFAVLRSEHLLSARLKSNLAMVYYLGMFLVQPLFLCLVCSAVVFNPAFWLFGALYLAWFLYDFRAPRTGAHFRRSFYHSPLWTHLANYFPVEVVKTADIPADRNYLFSSHPHGVLGLSSYLLLGTDGVNFSGLFPGIKMHLVTLGINFWFPFRRESILAKRIISSDPEAIEFVLASEEKGNAVGLVSGGAAEALESFPGTQHILLRRRKGFVRLAIKHGASLVPVYHFGETDLYSQLKVPQGSFVHRVQQFVKTSTGVSLPLCHGQSMLASFLPEEWANRLPRWLRVGLFPYRRKIFSVVGAPMDVEKDASPSEEKVNAVHAEYCARLVELFNAHKEGKVPEGVQLEFV